MSRVDIDIVRASNPPADVMSRLGMAPKLRGMRVCAPCPECGKSDRFDVHKVSGAFNCFSCPLSGGDVIALVQAVRHCGFLDAVTWLGGDVPLSAEERRALMDRAAQAEADAAARAQRKRIADKAQITTVLRGLQPGAGSPVQRYLEGRGLRAGLVALGWIDDDGAPRDWPKDVSFHPALDLCAGAKGERKVVGGRPGMVCLARDARGQVACLHRTFLQVAADRVTKIASTVTARDGSTCSVTAKQVLGPVGAATRGVALGSTDDVTHDPRVCSMVAEGIESALAVAAAGTPGIYYAALSLGRLVGTTTPNVHGDTGFAFPDDGRPRVVLCDNDLSPTLAWPGEDGGIRRAADLAARIEARLSATGDTVRAALPPPGMDFNDLLLAGQHETDGATA